MMRPCTRFKIRAFHRRWNHRFSSGVPKIVEIDYNSLSALTPDTLHTLRRAFVGPQSYGAIAITGIPKYAELRSCAFRAGIDLALKDAGGRRAAAAVNNTYPGWSGTPGAETHPLQSSFLFNTKEELNGRPDPYFGKNIFPSEVYRNTWKNFVKPMHQSALLVLQGLDAVMEEKGERAGFAWADRGRSLHRLAVDGPALASRFICYDSAFTREDRIMDEKVHEFDTGHSTAHMSAGHASDGLASMRTHSTPIKSSGVSAGHASDGLASMRTHSTPIKSSGMSAGHASDGLASMRTHSTPIKSSGMSAGHVSDGLASMRTHSTPIKSSGISAGHASDGLASMRTHSTPIKSSGVSVGHASDGLASMRTHSTPIKSSGHTKASAGDARAALQAVHQPEISRMSERAHSTIASAKTAGNPDFIENYDEKGEYWLPWHIDSNFVTLIHKEMYAYESDASLVKEPQGAGVVLMNKLGDVAPLDVPDDALIVQFGGFGQIYTGGEITACRHAVLSPKPNGVARFNFCNFWYAKWDTICDAPPGMERSAINTGWNAMMDESYLNISMKNGFAAFRQFMTSPEARLQFANSKLFHELAEMVPLPPRDALKSLQHQCSGNEPTMIVDLLTDVRCPFSYLAKLNLDIAIQKRGLQDQLVFRYHPVFLNPHVPKNGENLDDYLLREYNITKEYAHSAEYPLFKAGQEVGLTLNPNRRVVNTFDAFCLLEIAERSGLQTVALDEMSRRYFEKAEDISCEFVLNDIAKTIGLDVKDQLLSVEVAASVASKYVTLSQKVQEVPHFILRNTASGNGVELNGTRSVAEWEGVINAVLEKDIFVGQKIPGPLGKDLFLPNANPTSPISLAFPAQHGWINDIWPYDDADFARADETADTEMYSLPRFVNHLHDESIVALREVFTVAFSAAKPNFSVLDLCSSWTSHFPEHLMADARVIVHGMNEAELRRNKLADEFHLQDLNEDPFLVWEDNTFEFVTLSMSIQYLTKPQEVFHELHRVLKPGGMAIIAYSNRCFIDKTINIWAREVYDGEGHAHILRNYFSHSPSNGWTGLSSVDVSPKNGDPVWLVTALKAN